MTHEELRQAVAKELERPDFKALIARARDPHSTLEDRIHIAITARTLECVAEGEFDILDEEPHAGRDPEWITPRAITENVRVMRRLVQEHTP